MFYITSVEIEGFWGKYRAATDLNADVNIFIGKNGSGKTNFMNLLEAVLRIDLRMLVSLEFTSVTVKLKDGKRKRTVTVSKPRETEGPFEELTFRVGTSSFSLQFLSSDIDPASPYTRRRPRFTEEYTRLRDTMSDSVNISSLSVHRSAYEPTYGDEILEARRTPRSQKPPIDQRLEELAQRLTRYQLTLAERAAAISSRFQKDVLASMLYNAEFDRFGLEEALGVELSKEKDDLSKAYRELGAWDRTIAKKIDDHVSVLERSLSKLRTSTNYDVDDIMPLPLLRRTQHIIDLSRNAEKQKQEISKPVLQYVSAVREFILDKEISISPVGELLIQKDGKKIAISQLSSGEKQLLILLTETLLQQREPYIFLADEPELSLHIEWQEKIIDSIRRLNPNSQIIVATHSPEIAGGWNEQLIDMEAVIRG